MRTSAKLGLTALIAALLLASAVGTASAGRLSTNEQFIRTTWSSLEFESPIVRVRCPVTLEGSFHSRTIPKIIRTLLIGAITSVRIFNERCTNGRAGVRGLPWHVTYEGFTGTLPNISAILLLLQRFLFELINPGGLVRTCKYGVANDHITGTAGINAERLVTTLVPLVNANIANILEGPIGGLTGCPETGKMVGGATDGTTRILNTNGFIKITLI
jgi:hypothetical protein